MGNIEWPASLDEYEKLVMRMNTPRVVIDNAVCPTSTLIKVDSARKRGVLLEAVQILTDLDLHVSKAYISSDGRWFMDVFHVTDHRGRKLADEALIAHIEQSLSTIGSPAKTSDGGGGHPPPTALELTGADRPGLLSEILAVLADLHCAVAGGKLWTYNGRIASVIFLHDVLDLSRARHVEARLRNVLRRDHGGGAAISSASVAGADRRIHQLMLADSPELCGSPASEPAVSVQNWVERGYSIVSVQCRDRPKLLFDVVCMLTDMEYVVFHGTIDTDGDRARQEFYIKHSDGSPISSEAERQRVVHCLQAAIERRASEGLRLELCSVDRRGFLADVTRIFRENGLSVLRAELTASRNLFFVTDAAGQPADPKTIDAVIETVGAESLKVGEHRPARAAQKRPDGEPAGLFALGSIVKRNLYNLGFIRSC